MEFKLTSCQWTNQLLKKAIKAYHYNVNFSDFIGILTKFMVVMKKYLF